MLPLYFINGLLLYVFLNSSRRFLSLLMAPGPRCGSLRLYSGFLPMFSPLPSPANAACRHPSISPSSPAPLRWPLSRPSLSPVMTSLVGLASKLCLPQFASTLTPQKSFDFTRAGDQIQDFTLLGVCFMIELHPSPYRNLSRQDLLNSDCVLQNSQVEIQSSGG